MISKVFKIQLFQLIDHHQLFSKGIRSRKKNRITIHFNRFVRRTEQFITIDYEVICFLLVSCRIAHQ